MSLNTASPRSSSSSSSKEFTKKRSSSSFIKKLSFRFRSNTSIGPNNQIENKRFDNNMNKSSHYSSTNMSTRSVVSAATQTIETNFNTSNLNKKPDCNGNHATTQVEGSHLDLASKLFVFY